MTMFSSTAPKLDVPVAVSKPNRAQRINRVFKSKSDVSTAPLIVGMVDRPMIKPVDPYFVYRQLGDWNGRLMAAMMVSQNATKRKTRESITSADIERHAAMLIGSSLYWTDVPFGNCCRYTGKEKRVYKAGFIQGFRSCLDEVGGNLYKLWREEYKKAERDFDS